MQAHGSAEVQRQVQTEPKQIFFGWNCVHEFDDWSAFGENVVTHGGAVAFRKPISGETKWISWHGLGPSFHLDHRRNNFFVDESVLIHQSPPLHRS